MEDRMFCLLVDSLGKHRSLVLRVAALAAVGLALRRRAPRLRGTEPDAAAEEGLRGPAQWAGPGSIVYADGYSISVYAQSDRKTHTYTCNDGKWTETVSLTAGAATWRNVAILGTAGALQAVPVS
jgi:hypothetical protein